MLRFLFNLLWFKRTRDWRREVQQDLKATSEAHRAKAESSQDYFLKRDLERLKREERKT